MYDHCSAKSVATLPQLSESLQSFKGLLTCVRIKHWLSAKTSISSALWVAAELISCSCGNQALLACSAEECPGQHTARACLDLVNIHFLSCLEEVRVCLRDRQVDRQVQMDK